MGDMIMKEKTACFTGHRDIPQSELKQISKALKKAICVAYENGYRCFCSGGAAGFDLEAAETVLSLKRKYRDIKLILVIPCPEQTKYWSEKEIKRYEKIKAKADKIVCVSDRYFNGCMQKRNRFLADISSLCICYLTKNTGGTAYTVRYAQKEGLKIVNITDLIPLDKRM